MIFNIFYYSLLHVPTPMFGADLLLGSVALFELFSTAAWAQFVATCIF